MPSGLTVTSAIAPATFEPGNGSNGCATGKTRVFQDTGTINDTATVMTYTVTVDPTAAGGQQYKNTATSTGSTISNSVNDSNIERVITNTTDSTVTIPGQTVNKSVGKSTYTPGEDVSYTITSTLPANTNLWNSSIIDTLPNGLSTSVNNIAITCSNADTTTCDIPKGTTLPASGKNIGWLLGDMGTSTQIRTITIKFTSKLLTTETSNLAGTVKTNTANAKWNLTSKIDPTNASSSFDKTSNKATANFTVVAPLVTLSKTVADSTLAPGDSTYYTLTAQNSLIGNISTTYNSLPTSLKHRNSNKRFRR